MTAGERTKVTPELRAELERMREQICSRVRAGTDWLTADDLAMRASVSHAVLEAWRADGKTFFLQRDEISRYPAYAFDDKWRPLPAIAAILRLFEADHPPSIAAWFESPSGSLAGRRPREVIARDPEAAISAAQFSVDTERYP